MEQRSKLTILAFVGIVASVLLAACASLVELKSSSVQLGNITGHYKSDVSEGEVKKVILYMKESAVIKSDEKFNFTLEKKPDEYRVIIDLQEADKFDLTESPAALFVDLFGSSDKSKKLSEEQLLNVLFRGLAIGLTEDVLNEYTELRLLDNEQKRYRIYPPSFE
ncbi:hypothetical protein ACF3MZ_18165 [Paenibacillaceae bacterium WGS1546]|uniref:hypothetical protein n=1 Tax=Cohnella sp. WGS1546 TaxID=3366810 RepID=UPI00372D4E63